MEGHEAMQSQAKAVDKVVDNKVVDEVVQAMADEGAENDKAENGQAEQEPQEEPMDIPFGWFGITLLTNILQYTLFLGLSMVILIIIRVFMPAAMLNP